MDTIPFEQWSAHDWVAHYAGPQFDPNRAEVGSIWDAYNRRLPGYVAMSANGPRVYHTGQQSVTQRAAQAAAPMAQRGQQTAESTIHGVTSAVHHGIETATSPTMLLAGLAALGILGWVVVQGGRTVGKTIEGVAPHAAKALPLLAM